jgi:hypothetical protein
MAIKNPKTPRVTRKAKKVAKMYADNPTWAKEDAPGAYKKGGTKLPKAQYGENVGPVITNEYIPPYPGYKSPERMTKDKAIYQGPLNKSESKSVSKGMMSPTMQNYMKRPDQSKASEEANKIKKGGATKSTYKTGGMVNANAKITAAKTATGKSGGTTKAISKVAVKSASPKGRVGGTSTAPKKASPVKLAKAKMGGMKGKSC